MTVTVLFIALAFLVVALGILAFRIAQSELARRPTYFGADADPSERDDQELHEVRRGDRPDPPAAPADPLPDNVSPFTRRDGGDDRR